jgi:hypothetical protein
MSSLPLSFKCLSNTILFMVLAKSKLISLRREVVSDEDLPLRALVFYVILRTLLICSLSISGI